jgi:hypothetical protein
MHIIVGLIALLAATVVAIEGVVSNDRAAHPLTDLSVFGYHLMGGAGTLFLFGITVGAVASLGRFLMAPGVQPTDPRVRSSIRSP